jgi:hypothetical protein
MSLRGKLREMVSFRVLRKREMQMAKVVKRQLPARISWSLSCLRRLSKGEPTERLGDVVAEHSCALPGPTSPTGTLARSLLRHGVFLLDGNSLFSR